MNEESHNKTARQLYPRRIIFPVVNGLTAGHLLILRVKMIIIPIPGGSRFTELIPGRYLSDLIPADPVHAGGIALAMTIIWRIISYYPSLIIGASIIPGWIQRKFVKSSEKK